MPDIKRITRERLVALADAEGLTTSGSRIGCPLRCDDDPKAARVDDAPGGAVYLCEHCQQGGSALDLVMATRELDAEDAAAVLAELFPAAPPAPPAPATKKRDPKLVWASLAEGDPQGYGFLLTHNVEGVDLDGSPLVRFNAGASGDAWLDARARDGYRVALALHDVAGDVVTIQLRSIHPDTDPLELSLAGVTYDVPAAFGLPPRAIDAPLVYLADGMLDTLAFAAADGLLPEPVVFLGAPNTKMLKRLAPLVGNPAGRTFVVATSNDIAFRALAKSLHEFGGTVRRFKTPSGMGPAQTLTFGGEAAWVKLLKDERGAAPAQARVSPAAASDGGTALQTAAAPMYNGGGVTESTIAEVLVAKHQGELRYCAAWRKWLVYDGARWATMPNGALVQQRLLPLIRGLRAEVAQGLDEKATKALFAAEKKNVREAICTLASYEAPVQLSPDQLDRDPWALNVLNGTLDLRTGKLRPHRPSDYLSKLAPVAFDPDAECPRWERFLEEVFADHPGLVAFMQRALGYSLTGEIREHVLLIPWGSGRNGKGTLFATVLAILGDYAMPGAPEMLMAAQGERHPTDMADLFGRRLVVCQETTEGRRLDETRVKSLTGGDRVKARRMREDFWDFEPTHKLWLPTNHKPAIHGTDPAIWARVKLIPFDVSFIGREDTTLGHALLAELPGILRWLVDGCLSWQRVGLAPPEEVTSATNDYRHAEDRFGAFVIDRCVLAPGATAPSSALYASFVAWATERREYVLSAKKFAEKLSDLGLHSFDAGHAKTRTWMGIGLLETDRKPTGPGGDRTPEPQPEPQQTSIPRLT